MKRDPAAITVTVTVNPTNGRVAIQGPENAAMCFQVLQAGLHALFAEQTKKDAAPAAPKRKILTLDEMGVSVKAKRR